MVQGAIWQCCYFENYDNIPVEASGEACPLHVSLFEDCNFSEIILENIKVCCLLKCCYGNDCLFFVVENVLLVASGDSVCVLIVLVMNS